MDFGALLGGGEPTPALARLDVDAQGFAWVPENDFVGHFAANVDPVQAKVMYAVQQPLSMSTFEDVMGVPAWKSLPTWFMVAKNDEAIPPDSGAFVCDPHGRHHRGGGHEPRRDGVAPRRRGRPH